MLGVLLLLGSTLALALASPEVAPWLATYSDQGYSPPQSESYSDQGGQGYNPGQGGQGYNPGQSTSSTIAFSAQRALPSSRPGTPIAFERSLTNLGGGWGRDGATFTTPASGVYRYLNMLNMLQ